MRWISNNAASMRAWPTIARAGERVRLPVATVLLACIAAVRAPALAADVVIYRCTSADGQQSLQNAPCAKGLKQQKVMAAPLPVMPAHPTPLPTQNAVANDGLPPLRGCIDAQGGISIVRTACPVGSKPYSRTLQDVPTAPLPPAAPGPGRLPRRRYRPPACSTATAFPSRPRIVAAVTGKRRSAATPAASRAVPVRRPDRGSYYSEDYAPKSRCLPLSIANLDGSPGSGLAQACQMVTEVCAPVPDRQLCTAWKQQRDMAESRLRYAGQDKRDQAAADLGRLQKIIDETTCGAPDQTP
jgi:hypothetical protein